MIGVPGMILIKKQFVAPTDVPPFALFACTALTVVGVAILVVTGGSAAYRGIIEKRAESVATTAALAKKTDTDRSALLSLQALNESEQKVLYQILMRNREKFEFSVHSKTSLWQKDIVQQQPPSSGIFQVNPAIWERREELVEKFKAGRPWP